MRRSLAIGGTLTRGDIETLLDTCERLLVQHDEIMRILGDLGPAWSDARAALNRPHALLRTSTEREVCCDQSRRRIMIALSAASTCH